MQLLGPWAEQNSSTVVLAACVSGLGCSRVILYPPPALLEIWKLSPQLLRLLQHGGRMEGSPAERAPGEMLYSLGSSILTGVMGKS